MLTFCDPKSQLEIVIFNMVGHLILNILYSKIAQPTGAIPWTPTELLGLPPKLSRVNLISNSAI